MEPIQPKLNESNESKYNEPEMRRDLYVSNIPHQWTNHDLLTYFSKFKPLRARILNNQTTGFVNFGSHQNASDALYELNNSRPSQTSYLLRVKYARNRGCYNQQRRGGHGDRGRGGYGGYNQRGRGSYNQGGYGGYNQGGRGYNQGGRGGYGSYNQRGRGGYNQGRRGGYGRNSMRKGSRSYECWIQTKNKYGRTTMGRDLDKLQRLVTERPNKAKYHYEFSRGLGTFITKKAEKIKNPNLVQLSLKHLDIAIDLSKKQSKKNQPNFRWIQGKISKLISLYKTDDNCFNVDIDELVAYALNAATNYDRSLFYLPYLRVLFVTQREDLLTKSLKLYKEVWNGKERLKYFKGYKGFPYFVECMTQNGCDLKEIVDVMTTCWKYYHDQYGHKCRKFDALRPQQKSANFCVFLMVMFFTEYICNVLEWKVDEKILSQCLKWSEMVIPMRPYTAIHYIYVCQCYFVRFNHYVKARQVLEEGIKCLGERCIYDELNCMVGLPKQMNYNWNYHESSSQNKERWKDLQNWIYKKVFKDFAGNDGEDTPRLGGGGTIPEPGSKLNIFLSQTQSVQNVQQPSYQQRGLMQRARHEQQEEKDLDQNENHIQRDIVDTTSAPPYDDRNNNNIYGDIMDTPHGHNHNYVNNVNQTAYIG
eukprot:448039_1